MGLLDDYHARRERKKSHPTHGTRRGSGDQNVRLSTMLFVLSIICGNIASGYTTLKGLNETVAQFWLALLTTITIQGMMLATALVISNKEVIGRRMPFLILYIVPMLVSIGFNYIYFHSQFTLTSFIKSKDINYQIVIRNLQAETFKNGSEFIGGIKQKISEQLKKETAERVANTRARDEELTARGTGGAGPGPWYRHYRRQADIHRSNQTHLEGLLKEIKEKEGRAVSLLQHANIDSLQAAYAIISEISSTAGAFNKQELPNFPRTEQQQRLKKGEKHNVYEAFKALLHPAIFEVISLILGILMDFVIFVWVLVKLISKASLTEVIS